MNKQIEINPKVMLGKPIIKGTRIPVYLIVKMIAQGNNFEQIIEDYPQLTKKDISAALEYASHILNDEEIYPLKNPFKKIAFSN